MIAGAHHRLSEDDRLLRKEECGRHRMEQGEFLYRAPDQRESASRLARKAAEAEAEPRIGIHGVSAFTEPMNRPHSRAPRAEVEMHFIVHRTGGPTHRTIELPKPVTPAVADLFNRLFGR